MKLFKSQIFVCICVFFCNTLTSAQTNKKVIQQGNNMLIVQDFKLELIGEYKKSAKIYIYKKWKQERKAAEIANDKKGDLSEILNLIDQRTVLELNILLQNIANEHYKLQLFEKRVERESTIFQEKQSYFKGIYESAFIDKTVKVEEYRRKLIELKENENEFLKVKDSFANALFDFQKLTKYQLPNEVLPNQ